jgi:hypothetical protein
LFTAHLSPESLSSNLKHELVRKKTRVLFNFRTAIQTKPLDQLISFPPSTHPPSFLFFSSSLSHKPPPKIQIKIPFHALFEIV